MKTDKLKKIVKWIISLGFILSIGGFALINSCSSFGGDISGERLEKVKSSPNHKGKTFVNQEPEVEFGSIGLTGYFKEQLFGKQQRHPPAALPVFSIPKDTFSEEPYNGMRVTWLGHSSVLIEIGGKRILTDPVLSEYASPSTWFGPKRFHPSPIVLNDLPQIDAVLISHDHYDHLDMETTKYLASKGTKFYIPLGVGTHLERWDVPKELVFEMDWWDSNTIDGIVIHCTPTRHYSGRGLFNRKETLWSSWSVIGKDHKFFYSGDSGYGKHFLEIGKRFGAFDLSIIKVGAYGPGASWIDIHMEPEKSVQAHIDLGAKRLLPVHWATFNMGFHAWDEPIQRTVSAAIEKKIELLTPRLGEMIPMKETFQSISWWEEVK